MKRAETSGGADDNAETIQKRFDTFVTTSMPVVDHYEKFGKVAKVSAVPSPADVFAEVCAVMAAAAVLASKAMSGRGSSRL